MGKSYTYNVCGMSAEEKIDDSSFRRYECWCMTKLEMAQNSKNMQKAGTPVVGWAAQTIAGCKMIGASVTWEEIPDNKVKHIKTITCPICKGTGGKQSNGFKRICVICSGSGITKNGYWNKWNDWQIEEMKKEFA